MAQVIRSTPDEAVKLLKEASGRYVVMAAGRTVIETGVWSAAEILYEEEVERRPAGSSSASTGEAREPSGRSIWQRLLSVLPWVHDQEPRRAGSDKPSSEEAETPPPRVRVYRLVVDFDAGEWPIAGVLSEMGYHVGKNGLTTPIRRQILSEVLEVELVASSPETEDYIREWGAPRSAKRKNKTARCLAGFAAGARRRINADMSGAIADWESDLEWLTRTYGQ